MPIDTVPLFIVGAARSGTSYLHRLMNRHPGIRMTYESRLPTEGFQVYKALKQPLSKADIHSFLDKIALMEKEEDQNHWLCRTIASNRHILIGRHQTHGSFPQLVQDMCELACAAPLKGFGNKMLKAELCPEILALWPHARFILLMRDPRAVVASQIRRFKGRRLAYAAFYCDTHARFARQLARDRQRFLTVTYEAFVRKPETQLKRILSFAGLHDPFIESVMLQKSPPHATSVDKWRYHLSRDQIRRIEEICFDSMKDAGYTPEIAVSQKPINAIEKTFELVYEKREAFLYHPETWRRKNIVRRFIRILRQ
ncbi:MAG: sulfotransferase [Desulfobacterales bacterium]|nr:sulfotransferase [Desulfobacterales bacterium]